MTKYSNFSNDCINTINGTENVTVTPASIFEIRADWYSNG